MKRILALFFLFAAILSCKDDFTKMKTKDLIHRDKLIEILIGIHITDIITNSSNYYRKYEPGDSLDLYACVFEKYDVTQADFDSTVAMYIRQPDLYIKLYDEVLLKLNYTLDTLKNNNPQLIKEAIEE